MPAHPADSAIYRGLFGDADLATLLSDSAEIRAMLLVEGALARVQGNLGLIPADAAAFIERAAREVQIDPAAVGQGTDRNGVPVPSFLAAFRKAAEAPAPMAWLHWGATSQDIQDTALALRLRRVLEICDTRLGALIAALGHLAQDHAQTAMAARTYGQIATPSSFGAQVASWGRPLLAHRHALADLRLRVLRVSLSGAAGTLSAMGPKGPEVRAGLADALGLHNPGHSWHSERDGIAALGAWLAAVSASLGKLGEDLILLAQSGVAELRLEGAGGSSTMPQKQNPVGPSVLVALARHAIGLSGVLTGAALHRQARDGAAWFTEWLVLPQLVLATGRGLALAGDLAGQIRPDPASMARMLDADGGTIHAEALTFALSSRMPRPEAALAVKSLCARALSGGGNLLDLAARAYPGLSVTPDLGQGPAEARAFAALALGQGPQTGP